MFIFGPVVSDKQCRVGQGKPGFPHFADESSDPGVKIIANLLCKLQLQDNALDSESNSASDPGTNSDGPISDSEIEDESEGIDPRLPITKSTTERSQGGC